MNDKHSYHSKFARVDNGLKDDFFFLFPQLVLKFLELLLFALSH